MCQKRSIVGEYIPEKNEIESLFWSDYALQMYKLKEEEVIGKYLYEITGQQTNIDVARINVPRVKILCII